MPIQKFLIRLFLFSALSYAIESASFADPFPTPTPGEIQYLTYHLDPPPASGSLSDLQDFADEHAYQANRTVLECANAEVENTLTFRNLFGPPSGILTDVEVALAEAVAENTIAKVASIASYYKNYFKRNRPYVQDETIHPCVDLPGGYSYPSTHSTTGYTLSLVLTRLFPAKAAAILEQGLTIGEYRLIAGVHFPSDVEAGRILGEQIYRQLQSPGSIQE